jgi:cytochrome c oxidase cbb3-type subunit I/II
MPPYPWLAKRPIDFRALQRGVAAQVTLGVPYTADEVKGAAQLAREQGRQIAQSIAEQGGPQGLGETRLVALIAYLQRLGTDIKKSATAGVVTGPDGLQAKAGRDPAERR